ncbi:MAG: Mov34/MPN/PAD-1 family protein [Bacilli bacterium]
MERAGDQRREGGQCALMVTAAILEQIGRHVRHSLPYESGGILVGSRVGDTLCADEFVPLAGASPSAHRYLARAEQATRAVLRADRAGKSVVATVHSHPDGAGDPSSIDMQDAYGYRDMLHIVVHFCHGAPVCRVYQYHRTTEGYRAHPAALVVVT